ncbi:hypothetical protein BH09MYX1_BH09MYX1_57010 [soil metagenome]
MTCALRAVGPRAVAVAALFGLALGTSFCQVEPPSHVPERTGPLCEAISECGFWQGCAYLVPIEPTTTPRRYRVASGDAKDKVFARLRSCSPAVGAGETCLEYCSGGASVVCAEGFSLEGAKCEETARPQRASFHCSLEPNGNCIKTD